MIKGVAVPGEDDLQQSDIDQASAQLDEGLKSCRAVVRDYRAMLSGGSGYPDTLSDYSHGEEAQDDST